MEKNGAGAMVSKRNYGIDLLRIVAMFMVVVIHIAGDVTGITGMGEPLSAGNIMSWLLYMIVLSAIDVYGLITGYVCVGNEVKYKNIINLLFQVWFYTLSITGIFLLVAPEKVTMLNIAQAVLPVTFGTYWYFSTYFIIFLFIPFVNRILERMSNKTLVCFSATLIVLFCLYKNLLLRDTGIALGGHGILWFTILYIIGATVKKCNLFAGTKKRYLLIGCLCCVFITLFSKVAIEFVTLRFFGESRGSNMLNSHLSISIVLYSVLLLGLFSKISVKGTGKKLVKFFAPMTFGVYLAHCLPLFYQNVLSQRFIWVKDMHWTLAIVLTLLISAGIYIVASLIDYIRIKLFKLLRIFDLSEYIVKTSRKIIDRITT